MITLDTHQEQLAQRLASPRPGRIAAVAAAGSGKTRTVVEAVARWIDQGGRPDRVLVATFTSKAAGEIRERLAADPRIPFGSAGQVKAGMRVGTFHALLLQQLPGDRWSTHRVKGRCLDTSAVLPSPSQIWSAIIGHYDVPGTHRGTHLGRQQAECGLDLYADAPDLKVGDVLLEYGRWASCNASYPYQPGAVPRMDEALELYQRAKEGLGAFDFADVLREAAYGEWAPPQFDLVIVDEAQDNSPVQIDVALRWVSPEGRLALVGDPRQSIYAFRSARPELFLDYMTSEGTELFELPTNYRSGRTIVEAADAAFRHQTFDATQAREGAPEGAVYDPDQKHENRITLAAEVAATVADWIRISKVSPQEIAILTRTNEDAVAYYLKLQEQGVLASLGAGSIFSRGAGALFMDALSIAHHDDLDALSRVQNKPYTRYLSKPWVLALRRNLASSQGLPHAILQTPSPPSRPGARAPNTTAARRELAQWVGNLRASDWPHTAYVAASKLGEARPAADAAEADRAQRRRETLQTCYEIAQDFATYDAFSRWAQRLDNQPSAADRVQVLTIHAAKGLEWDRVVVDMTKLPHPRGEVEEEERLTYVAFTRARDVLFRAWYKATQEA